MGLVLKGSEPKSIDLEDGRHEGQTILAEERTPEGKDYSYLDLYIRTKEGNGEEVELKVGYAIPKALTKNTDLGQLIERFTGKPIEKDKDYDLQSILVGKRVGFLVANVSKDGNSFAEVQKHTVKVLDGAQ